MGVDYYPCCNCDGVACDHNVIGECGACGKSICHRCYDQCKRGSHTCVCVSCWNDYVTPADLEGIVEHLLDQHELHPEWETAEDVRKVLRSKGYLHPPCITLDEEEEKVQELIAEIHKRGLDVVNDDETEDESEEDDDDKKHERPDDAGDRTDEPVPKQPKLE